MHKDNWFFGVPRTTRTGTAARWRSAAWQASDRLTDALRRSKSARGAGEGRWEDRGGDRAVVGAGGRGEGGHSEGTRWMAEKLANLRLFPDGDGKMNLSVLDLGADGGILIVPNFTVAGDCRKGRRPGFDGAMKPPRRRLSFQRCATPLGAQGVRVARGVFGADMRVALVNDGPVTVVVETPARGG
ncbi:MAG: D-aminoacyl-tRNA deacylase [Phycisphaerales bacterium]